MTENYNISEELVKQLIKNQRSDRRWKNLRFFIVIFIIIGGFFGIRSLFTPGDETSNGNSKGYVALVRMQGFIFPDAPFSAENMLPALTSAFKDKHAKGVILDINSGGGSPVQSAIIHDKILQLKKKYHKKVVVVGEDVLASGAYLVAMSADEVYVNQDTITGSIGVAMEGFGFTDAIKKLGVDRRVYTAGKNKVQMDPFEPTTPAMLAKTRKVLDEVHDHFIDYVKTSRGDRLKGDPEELFSGDFWVGSTALKLGIVDGLGNVSDVMAKEFKVNHYIDYSVEPSIFDDIAKGFRSELDYSLGYHSPGVVTQL